MGIATRWLILMNCSVYVLMALGAGQLSFSAQYALSWGADFPPLTLGGQWWRLVSCMFVHFSLFHLLGNMSCLAVWGSLTERFLGPKRQLIWYFVFGIIASLASVLLGPENVVSAGASGAISGLLGLMVAMWLRGFPQISGQGLFINMGLNVGLAFMFPVDWIAHLAGLCCGILAGLGLFGRWQA